MKNQCDGCCAEMPLNGGIHYNKRGYPEMVCTAGNYIGIVDEDQHIAERKTQLMAQQENCKCAEGCCSSCTKAHIEWLVLDGQADKAEVLLNL